MKKRTVLVSVTLLFIFAVQTSASAPVLPNPVLYFLGPEFLTISGKQVTRYNFDVLNKTEYPNDLFAAAPDLPPCGTNTKAARTWVDIYDQSGKRLNGFCALGKPADLHGIWFSLDSGVVPPSWVYIEMTDRKTNTKYKSNLSETTY
ncbi:MAG TPA: hypothetical protein VJ306_05750 [Pyrinomonadaceae bacterium]|jgi:hypothetical protein|nr:hypothetical protein [Pyrinomonadaceae bacterium]